ncbi:MAG: NAD(P)H-dependent oxidoreductase [Pseudomonadota bacterium]
MNVLIVFAHNEPQSFNAAMKNLAVEELQAQGHAVTVSDLYAMDWNPVASAADFQQRQQTDYLVYALEQRHADKNGTLAPDIKAELEKVMWADLVILHFPVYWFSMPAILKGWIDRVLVSGTCYGGMRFYDRGGLSGKRAMLTCTLGGQQHMVVADGVHGELDAMFKPILRGTLAYVGLSVLPTFVGYHVPYISQEARTACLLDYRRHLQALHSMPAIAPPSLDEFDATLHRLR